MVPSTYNQRSSEKMKADEGLGSGATISAVLYANMNHPEWKNEYPSWSDRYKQIIKKWRTLSPEQKAPYLLQAKDNRSALRMKKQQQVSANRDYLFSANYLLFYVFLFFLIKVVSAVLLLTRKFFFTTRLLCRSQFWEKGIILDWWQYRNEMQFFFL